MGGGGGAKGMLAPLPNYWGSLPPPPPLFLRLCCYAPEDFEMVREKPQFPFLDQGQQFVIFFNGCLEPSANILIGETFLVRDIFSNSRQYLILKACIFSLDLPSRSVTHKHKNVDRSWERISFDPSKMLRIRMVDT